MHAKVLVAAWLVEHHANVVRHAKGHQVSAVSRHTLRAFVKSSNLPLDLLVVRLYQTRFCCESWPCCHALLLLVWVEQIP